MDDRSRRQIARSQRRNVGEQSARLASTLMKLSDAVVKKLALEDDVREAIERARSVTALVARRRAERTLAGDLRRFDLDEIARQLALDTGGDDKRRFHAAEQWRTRLIAEGAAALAQFPHADDQLPDLVAAAQRERLTGRPQGAARALFRHIVALLG